MGDTSKGSILRGPFGELRPLAAALTLGFGLSLSPTTYAANFTVSNLNDSGAGSLRDAITQANAAPGADTTHGVGCSGEAEESTRGARVRFGPCSYVDGVQGSNWLPQIRPPRTGHC